MEIDKHLRLAAKEGDDSRIMALVQKGASVNKVCSCVHVRVCACGNEEAKKGDNIRMCLCLWLWLWLCVRACVCVRACRWGVHTSIQLYTMLLVLDILGV
jgi:hypothetical protein